MAGRVDAAEAESDSLSFSVHTRVSLPTLALLLVGVATADDDVGGSVADGRHALISVRTGDHDLFVRVASGGEEVQLTSDSAMERYPAWSPDGKRIAFSWDRAGNHDIWTIAAAGGEPEHVTEDEATDLQPSWAHDGRRIVFVSRRDGLRQLYVMGADGSDPVRVSSGTVIDFDPAWPPGG